uniref:Uncharacterized protein LOC113798328 n=1 Tax=Dermatophagoides pteronyssinus TaxID=6956 RepID=A0A6P6YIF3_DERPT|nr:uncharacterized protein LOC113798328 [Dermatophagoides pteronyssinus]
MSSFRLTKLSSFTLIFLVIMFLIVESIDSNMIPGNNNDNYNDKGNLPIRKSDTKELPPPTKYSDGVKTTTQKTTVKTTEKPTTSKPTTHSSAKPTTKNPNVTSTTSKPNGSNSIKISNLIILSFLILFLTLICQF